jgi:hypothetical protein
VKPQTRALTRGLIITVLGNVLLVVMLALLFTSVTDALLILLGSLVLAFLLIMGFFVVRLSRPDASVNLRKLMLLGLIVAFVGFGSEGFFVVVGNSTELFGALGVMIIGMIVSVACMAAIMHTPRKVTTDTTLS